MTAVGSVGSGSSAQRGDAWLGSGSSFVLDRGRTLSRHQMIAFLQLSPVVYTCMCFYLYIHKIYTVYTHIYYVKKNLFWMWLITINRLTALYIILYYQLWKKENHTKTKCEWMMTDLFVIFWSITLKKSFKHCCLMRGCSLGHCHFGLFLKESSACLLNGDNVVSMLCFFYNGVEELRVSWELWLGI